MDVDSWYEVVDLDSYLDEDTILKSLDDVDLEAERLGGDRRIFRLEDFFVYDESDVRRLIPLDFDKLDGLCIAGKAIPIYPDDTDDEKDENEPPNTAVEFNVRLSAIQKVEYTFLDVSMAGYDGIHVLTSIGWYLLQRPAEFYLDTYKETYHQFRLALAILRRAYEDPSEKLSKFITKFRQFAARIDKKYTNALEYGYSELRPSDLQQSSASIARNINFFIHDLKAQLESGELDSYQRGSIADVHDRLMQSRIIHKVLQGYLATIRRREDIQAAPLPPSLTVPEPLTIADDETSDEDMDEEENDSRKAKPGRRTCVTPIIERVARRVFIHPLNLIGTPLPDVTWEQSRSRGTPVAGNGVKMRRGQCILVPAGIDEVLQHEDWTFNHEKSRSENSAANEYWFAQVLATTEDGERLHVRWFDHSSKTVLLKELERPMELFLTQRCGYIQRSHVKRTVDVQWIGPRHDPVDKEEHYYVRFIRELDGSYTWAKQSDIQLDPTEKREMTDNCEVCERAKTNGIWFKDKTLKINGLDLHKGDFIVTQPTDSSPWFDGSRNNRTTAPGQIFQLVGLTRAKEGDRATLVALLLQPLERVNTLSARGLVGPDHAICPGRPERDERRVCLMDTWNCRIELADIKRHPLRKCFVRHPDAFESIEDMNDWLGKSPIHFIVDLRAQPSLDDPLEDPLNLRPAASVETLTSDVFRELARPCGRCQNEMDDTRVTKLRMLDLFCGAGGLAQGLVASGVCVPEFALDRDGAALETYRRNFLGVKTIHQDANVALSKSLIAALKGHDRAPTSEDLDEPLPLPGKHDVDLICAGPPCQSFSSANRFKRDDDPRTAMVAMVMSAIAHYRPKYFLIESIPNAFTARIAGPTMREGSTHSDSTDSTEGPSSYVEQGVYRFIVRSALDLGYAFRVGILQAAEYGAPQLRRRAFIIGARDGHTLPDFPLATHCVPRPNTGLRQPNGSYVDPIRDRSGNAVHRPITIWDAIGDLAPFEWVNPHFIIRQTETSREEEQRRRTRLKIPPYNAVHEDRTAVGPGANGAIPYRDEAPFTTYQHMARGNLESVTAHYTSSFKSEIFVERVVSIHLNAYADHRTLPEALRKGDFMSNIFGSGGTNDYYKGGFGRYAKEQQFLTILTSLRPAKKNGFCIHPEQKRMLTMRELARAQGFPDRFRFFGTVDQVNRQIGDADTIPLAQAIGREIRKATLRDRQF